MQETKIDLDHLKEIAGIFQSQQRVDKDTAGSFLRGMNSNQFLIMAVFGIIIWGSSWGMSRVSEIQSTSQMVQRNAEDIIELRNVVEELANSTAELDRTTRSDINSINNNIALIKQSLEAMAKNQVLTAN